MSGEEKSYVSASWTPPVPNHLDDCRCLITPQGTPLEPQFTRVQGSVAGHTVTLDLDPGCRYHGTAAHMIAKDSSLLGLGFAFYAIPSCPKEEMR